MTDTEIAQAMAEDPDAAPPLDEDFWRTASLVIPPAEIPFYIRLDDDVAAFFRDDGEGYGSRINDILRDYIERQRLRKAGED